MAVRRLHMNLDQTRRKQKTLHMLVLSGVVRPSHTALRYSTLLTQTQEQPTSSENNALSPAQATNHLHRAISSLRRWVTQLLSREPQYVQPSTFAPRRGTTSRMCLPV
jgi:hypothetical protein